MTFKAYSTDEYQGTQAELFLFTTKERSYWYTSGDTEIEYNGDLYLPATISSPASTWRPFGACSASLEKPAQTSPFTAATTRWPSKVSLTAWLLVRSRPVTRPFESDDSNLIAGLDRSTSTTLTAWLPIIPEPRPGGSTVSKDVSVGATVPSAGVVSKVKVCCASWPA